MAYDNETVAKVRRAYHERLAAERRAAEARLEEVHRTIPEIAEIDRALEQTGRRLIEAIGQGSSQVRARVEALREENLQLQRDRADLLAFHGLPADYTEIRYTCPDCRDTGYRDLTVCHCLKKALALAGLESAGMAGLAGRCTFDNFLLSYYHGEDRALMAKNLEILRAYADAFTPASGNLLLMGGTGLGKTHLSCAVARAVIERGYDVCYQSAPDLFASFEAEKFNRPPRTPTTSFFEAELLILDDLGAENPGNLNVNFIYHLINTRLVSARATLISTNLSPAELRARYTDRIASRLFGEYRLLRFCGNDVRMQKLGG